MESIEHKAPSNQVDIIEHVPVNGDHHEHAHHSQLAASHLYEEDKDGNVIGRRLIPRPTTDPKDPLVRTELPSVIEGRHSDLQAIDLESMEEACGLWSDFVLRLSIQLQSHSSSSRVGGSHRRFWYIECSK